MGPKMEEIKEASNMSLEESAVKRLEEDQEEENQFFDEDELQEDMVDEDVPTGNMSGFSLIK